jgi:hypothetical protein
MWGEGCKMAVWENDPDGGNDLPKCIVNNSYAVRPEVLAATEFNEIFSVRQPHQNVKFFRRFGI